MASGTELRRTIAGDSGSGGSVKAQASAGRSLLAWLWGISCFMTFAGALAKGEIVSALAFFACGLIALPPVWSAIAARGIAIPSLVRVLISAALFVIGALTSAASPDDGSAAPDQSTAEIEPTDPVAARLASLRSKISGDAVIEMDRAGFAKTYSTLGRAQFERANSLMPWAAVAAAESEQCNKVEMVNVSDRATREEVQWFVDCANNERFQIRQAQAEAAQAKFDPDVSPEDRQAAQSVAVAEPKSARWKNFNEGAAVNSCKTLVRSTMVNQGSFDAAWTWDRERDDDTGLVTIQQDFEADNAFGGTISSRYHCVVDTNLADRIVELSIREPDGWRNLM